MFRIIAKNNKKVYISTKLQGIAGDYVAVYQLFQQRATRAGSMDSNIYIFSKGAKMLLNIASSR